MPININHAVVAICQPNNFNIPVNIPVWRYMSFPKYVSFLQTKSLYFSPIKKLQENDPYEGSITKEEFDYFEKQPDLRRQMNRYYDLDLKKTYVNCWHMNDVESQAMWKLYSSSYDEAICIQTTYQKLMNAFDEEKKEINIGCVQYIDHNIDKMYKLGENKNLLKPFMFKHKSFRHEQEVRMIYISKENLDTYPPSQNFSIDINSTIENIFVSPTPKSCWLLDVVKKITQDYGITINVSQSLPSPYNYEFIGDRQ